MREGEERMGLGEKERKKGREEEKGRRGGEEERNYRRGGEEEGR